MYKLIILSIIIGFCTSCAKEYSFENPILGNGNTVIVGNNCTISKIIDYDTLVRKNVAAVQTSFNTTGNYPASIIETDSLTQQVIFQKSLTLLGDTLRIDANQYFLVDIATNYRVRQFVGRQDPYNNNSPIFINNFFYNTAGQIVTKIVYSPTVPGAIFSQTNYTYTANNLTGIQSKIPLNNITYFDATISYDSTKLAKNYLLMLPESNELRPYVTTMNLGIKSKNQPTKITINNNDQITGALVNTTVTEFKNYRYSADGYVLGVDMGGFSIPAIPLSNSRNLFQYFCR
jgi:hypothetical protein